jgi:prepilin signal peptidase PulO-like enzyme (type II secretory pathway)
MYFEPFVIYLGLILVGLCMGSFAGATMWRLRARQLVQDKADGEVVDKQELDSLKKLTKSSILNDHSQCLNCSYRLKWYDLVPLISWLSLRGRCRKCHHPIGGLEPLIEIGVALFFVLSYIFWPLPLSGFVGIARLVIWLMAGVALAILFAYDKKWFVLPNQVVYFVIGLGLINTILTILYSGNILDALINVVVAALILSGLYFALYQISKGKWVGFGDVKLGLGLALLLADWRFAFIALFAANLIGCIIVLPSMARGKLKRDSHVPFGPLLIIGSIIALLAGNYLISWYISCLS